MVLNARPDGFWKADPVCRITSRKWRHRTARIAKRAKQKKPMARKRNESNVTPGNNQLQYPPERVVRLLVGIRSAIGMAESHLRLLKGARFQAGKRPIRLGYVRREVRVGILRDVESEPASSSGSQLRARPRKASLTANPPRP